MTHERVIPWVRIIPVGLALLLLAVEPAPAREPKKSKGPTAASDLARYIERARRTATVEPPSVGSLWTSEGRLADLATDYKARKVNDLIVIRIVEQVRAAADGSVQSQRKFDTRSGLSGLFGQPGATSGLRDLLTAGSDTKLDGAAQTQSNSRLQTNLAGQVVEVLPNGILVVQAVREVEMNNQRQWIVVRGLVRPGDVGPDNIVLSTAISNLEVELKGKGVISDGVRPPNLIVRLLLRILGF